MHTHRDNGHLKALIVAAAAVAGLSGCRGATAVAPSPNGPGSGSAQLTGVVSNSITGPIRGAHVVAIDGPLAGAAALTGADGTFSLPYRMGFDGHLQISKDGYAPVTLPVSGRDQSDSTVAIALHVAETPLTIAGRYTITFVADPVCVQIPEALRTRSFVANLDQATAFPQNTRFDGELSGASFAPAVLRGELNSFFGFVEGSLVSVRIANLFESAEVDEGIAEQIAPGVRLDIFGASTLTATDPTTLSARMSGYFAVRDGSGLRTCNSPNHLLEMRRGNPSPQVLSAFGRPSLANTRPR